MTNPSFSAWHRLCPQPVCQDAILRSIESYLDEPETRGLLDAHERDGSYPQPVVDALRSLGLPSLLVDVSGDDRSPSRVTAFHLCALNSITARRCGSVAITVGVNILALLPAHVGANDEQLEKISRLVSAGAFSSMLLTELPHGSNLLRNQATAEGGTLDDEGNFVAATPDVAGADSSTGPTHYRLRGEKNLINGGQYHDLFFVFLRTKNFDRYDEMSTVTPLAARGDFAFFWLERQEGVEALPRWETLPARAADISGVRFHDVVIPAEQRLGRQSGGFALVQKTLILSRGGIAALASGCVGRARDLAFAYAEQRNVYGGPIAKLGAIADHLLRLEALNYATAAVSVKATACLNALGVGAAHYTSVAKLIACALAEEGVTEGRYVLGGRALLRDLPYERLVRDVTLYGVFDGTSHVILDEISSRLSQEAGRASRAVEDDEASTIDEFRAIYMRPARRLRDVLRDSRGPYIARLDRHLEALDHIDDMEDQAIGEGRVALESVALLVRSLFGLVRMARTSGAWATDQGLRHGAAEQFAVIEALTAVVELCETGRRRALGLGNIATDERDAPAHEASTDALCRFLVGWLGGRAAAAIRRVSAMAGLGDDEQWVAGELSEQGGFASLEATFAAEHARGRDTWLARYDSSR